MRQLRATAPPDVEIWQNVAVQQVGQTGRLESITYHIFARQGREQRIIAEVTIELDYSKSPTDPKVLISAEPVGTLFGS